MSQDKDLDLFKEEIRTSITRILTDKNLVIKLNQDEILGDRRGHRRFQYRLPQLGNSNAYKGCHAIFMPYVDNSGYQADAEASLETIHYWIVLSNRMRYEEKGEIWRKPKRIVKFYGKPQGAVEQLIQNIIVNTIYEVAPDTRISYEPPKISPTVI